MSERVNELGNVTTVYEKKFEVTKEWCLAINNIDYIRQNLYTFVKVSGTYCIFLIEVYKINKKIPINKID